VKKRGLIILGVIVLLGAWLMVVGYEFLEKENARFQTSVKAAKDEQQRCTARNSKYRNYDQFRTSIRLPYTSDLSLERWMRQYDTVRAGMSESEVEIILGAPDYARCILGLKGDKFEGWYWQYEVAVDKDVANDSENSEIVIMFGPDGKLRDKNAVNMQPKPSPSPTPIPVMTPLPSGTPQGATPTPAIVPGETPAAAPQLATPSATATPSPTPQ
jgi:hypothetical protein